MDTRSQVVLGRDKLLREVTNKTQSFIRDSNSWRRNKREISTRLNAIRANVLGADQVKNRDIIENVWKILPGDGNQNERFPAKIGGLESLLYKWLSDPCVSI